MTPSALVAPAQGTRWTSPDALDVGDVVFIGDMLPSDEGYVHVVADVRDIGRGFVRVLFEVFEADGERRVSALDGRSHYQWDRLYDLAPRRQVGHTRACTCARCTALESIPMVEVVS
jgi:hypothetical protein